MLTAFTLNNFKSFREARLPLGPLTVLIGANAAGKSNAIEALRLLSWLAQGQKLNSIQYAVNSAERVVRGRINDLCYRGSTQFGLGFETNEKSWNHLSMEIALRDGELHIVKERVYDPSEIKPLYDLEQPSKGIGTDARVVYNQFPPDPTEMHFTVSDQMAVFAQFGMAEATISEVVKNYQRLLSSILFLDPVPVRMREYSFLGDKRLIGDGTNLSSVLAHLWGVEAFAQTEPFRTQRRVILDFIQSLPEQDIENLSFVETPRGEVMVQLVETFGGEHRPYDASLLSDGTLRVLAIAGAMESAQEGSIVVIEEIDNGVHPSRSRHLLNSIRRVAEDRKLRVLLSTHNPAMLDALPDAAVPDVVFCYRDLNTGASKLISMHDLPDAPELLVQGPLGQLMTSGALERFVKTHPGTEVRKRKAKEWLDSLRASGSGDD